jgi:peptide/nickel transport system substrate-binding protein
MRRRRSGPLPGVAAAAGIALLVSACGGSSGTNNAGAAGNIVEGGHLKLVGGGDIDHMDTASAYYSVTYSLLRGISRQLVSYPNDADPDKARQVVPDIATAMPTVSSDGLTYTMTLRDGVQWDTKTGARQVTGADAVRGFKRLCNPVQPTGAPGYYVGVVAGMKEYCDAFAKVPATIAGIKAYVEGHEISGVSAKGNTLTIKLVQPAGDFVNILALPFSSPAPVESLETLPDSPQARQAFVSDGPYKVAKYVSEQSIELVRNPAWKKSSDPLRAAHVDTISIVQGSDEGPVQQQLMAGTADMSWDTYVPTAQIPSLRAAKDPRLALVDNGAINPYISINLQSPNAGGALKKLAVRQAINYATNKKAIVQVLGGPDVYTPTGQVLTPTLLGYKKFDPYPTPESAGDPAKAKAMLAAAGYPNGLDLVFLYRNKGKAPAIASTMQAELKKAGIRLKLKVVPNADFYTQHLQKPAATKSGDWDLAAPGWNPDWQGNAARSFLVPLLDGRQYGEGSTNYNDYDSPVVNALIDKALAEKDLTKVADLWHQADQKVMTDAPWVPVATGKNPLFHGTRVQHWVYFDFANNGDITNVWLKDGK